jgi:SPW repeat-containing protein
LQAAGWSAIVVGIGFAVFEDIVPRSEVEEWIELGLGLALMGSPWLPHCADSMPGAPNAVISGFLISGIAT